MGCAEKNLYHPDRRHTLQTGARKNNQPRFGAQNPQCVCGSRIAASVLLHGNERKTYLTKKNKVNAEEETKS